MDAKQDTEAQRYVQDISAEEWFSAAHWAKENGRLLPWQRALLYSAGRYKVNCWHLSTKQAHQAAKAHKHVLDLGFLSDQRTTSLSEVLAGGKEEIPEQVSASLPALSCPVRLPRGYPRLIAEHVEDLTQSLLEEDLPHLPRKALLYLEGISHSRTAWIRRFAWYGRLLAAILESRLAVGEGVADPSVRAIAGALMYILDRQDIIPDHTPGIGLADDAYAVACAIQVIERQDAGLLIEAAQTVR